MAAVKKYAEINKVNTENLLTVDIICHGVPSDLYIKEHVKNICNGGGLKLTDYHLEMNAS